MTGSAKQSRVTCSSPMFASATSASSFLLFMCLNRDERCRAAHPGGLPFQCRFEPSPPPTEGSGAPKLAAAERRGRWSALRRAPPVSGRDCRSMTPTGAPLGAPLRRFPYTPGPPSGNGTGLPTDGTPLIQRAFARIHPFHQPFPGRTHIVGPGGSPRPPRSDWQAHPPGARLLRQQRHRLAPSVSRGDDGHRRGGWES